MDLHPLDPLGAYRPDRVDAGWARRVSRGERTLGEILRDAAADMEAEDEQLRRAADPVWYYRPRHARRSLLGWLFRRR